MSEATDKKVEMLARGVSKLFPDTMPQACACIDSCPHLGCPQNWRMLLSDPRRLERLLRIGMAVTREENLIKEA